MESDKFTARLAEWQRAGLPPANKVMETLMWAITELNALEMRAQDAEKRLKALGAKPTGAKPATPASRPAPARPTPPKPRAVADYREVLLAELASMTDEQKRQIAADYGITDDDDDSMSLPWDLSDTD